MNEGVKETLLVLSGKGGVGKSTVTVQLASSLVLLGYKVGILDVDLCGPSIPRMLNIEAEDVRTTADGKWIPVYIDKECSLGVISIAFFLSSNKDAVIWRGPKKNAMIKQFLTNVAWDVDYLVIDTPPGTSDEHISLMENLRGCKVKGSVLVSTPQMVSVDDVTREITFCKRTGIPILGLIENMAGFVCPHCTECSNLFAFGGGEELCKNSSIPFLGRIPIDPLLAKAAESGGNFVEKFKDLSVASVFKPIVMQICGLKESGDIVKDEEQMEME